VAISIEIWPFELRIYTPSGGVASQTPCHFVIP
jgi:hypothetical protein